MPVSLLLVTHHKLGHTLLETVEDLLGKIPLTSEVFDVRRVANADPLIGQARQVVEKMNAANGGAGVLLLTDAYGSTPSNVACKASKSASPQGQTRVVAGVNVPMLLNIYNFPKQSLDKLAQLAVQGGQQGVCLGE